MANPEKHYKILTYHALKPGKTREQFKRVVGFLEKGDFAAAEVKKLGHGGYYRAKLDYENRLLFSIGRYQGETCLLLLEVILNHNYAGSRFLRGAEIDEAKLKPLPAKNPIDEADVHQLAYLNPKQNGFRILDRVLSFDDEQEAIFQESPPLVIIGSAGSGKTMLTLSRMQLLPGDLLYVSHSPFLVENASRIYRSFNFEDERQNVDFLNFKELLQTIRIPKGKEMEYRDFEQWFHRHRQASGIKDSHKLFEEFKGVLTGSNVNEAWLSREDYLHLGVKRSIFLDEEREKVYDLFEKYLAYLDEQGLYDLNITTFKSLEHAQPTYDYVVVDEVQDFTNIQLQLIFKTLRQPNGFILSGDSNQVVHPNFFSWTGLRSMFYEREGTDTITRILQTNFRNAPEVTRIANRLLRIKRERFGSIDRESNYLVRSVSDRKGEFNLISNDKKTLAELDGKTRKSRKFAVVVLRDEDKARARKYFQTPLLFSVHEAKGLEYENIILVNMISENAKEFREIASGVALSAVEKEDELSYSRAKDKKDKSLEAYKFYVNALYVAITRAVENIYLVEDNNRHEILTLLGLTQAKAKISLKQQESTNEEWQEEAKNLELRGKKEQADQIRRDILRVAKPDWVVLDKDGLKELKVQALNPEHFNNKAKEKLFAYSVIYGDQTTIAALSALKFRKADRYADEEQKVWSKHYSEYLRDDPKSLQSKLQKYGPDFIDQFNLTPLAVAIRLNAFKIATQLIQSGASVEGTDSMGKNILQTLILRSWQGNENWMAFLLRHYQQLSKESLRVKVNDRLIKIDFSKAEYFLLNFFIATQHEILNGRPGKPKGVMSQDLVEYSEKFPETIVAAYRKARPYLSSLLARNEVDNPLPSNRKLVKRLTRGCYIINPDLEILLGEEWINIYNLLGQTPMTIEKSEELAAKEAKEIKEEAQKAKWEAARHRAGWW